MAKRTAKPAPPSAAIDPRFAALLAELARDARLAPAVEAFFAEQAAAGPRRFGKGALKHRGKIFAMFVRGQLVVKLPAARVAALVAAGHAEPFTANKSVAMKEWAALRVGPRAWPKLARDAHGFAVLSAR
jgi:hypothetical protein